jgi:hypothetical protein
MKWQAALAGALASAVVSFVTSSIALPSIASAEVRIVSDPGGEVSSYVQKYEAVRASGERVVIDGPCLSACTMLLGVIPHERICVTPRARLGFHAAWHPGGNGQQVTSREATQLLMDIYPENVRNWIARRGGLSPRMMYLSGRELTAMYQTCD